MWLKVQLSQKRDSSSTAAVLCNLDEIHLLFIPTAPYRQQRYIFCPSCSLSLSQKYNSLTAAVLCILAGSCLFDNSHCTHAVVISPSSVFKSALFGLHPSFVHSLYTSHIVLSPSTDVLLPCQALLFYLQVVLFYLQAMFYIQALLFCVHGL